MPTTSEDKVARYCEAFNVGSDARIVAEPLWANPYNELAMAHWWEKGWIDVDRFWAKEVKGRWFPKLIPPARGNDREPESIRKVGEADGTI